MREQPQAPMSEPSLDYYISIFRNNPQNLVSVKALLLKDFKTFESRFIQGVENHDFQLIKKELHKMLPIVSNLRYHEMVELIHKYESLDPQSPEFHSLNPRISECLSRIFQFLEHQ